MPRRGVLTEPHPRHIGGLPVEPEGDGEAQPQIAVALPGPDVPVVGHDLLQRRQAPPERKIHVVPEAVLHVRLDVELDPLEALVGKDDPVVLGDQVEQEGAEVAVGVVGPVGPATDRVDRQAFLAARATSRLSSLRSWPRRFCWVRLDGWSATSRYSPTSAWTVLKPSALRAASRWSLTLALTWLSRCHSKTAMPCGSSSDGEGAAAAPGLVPSPTSRIAAQTSMVVMVLYRIAPLRLVRLHQDQV